MLKCPGGSTSTPSEGPPVPSPGSGEGKVRPRNLHILGAVLYFSQFDSLSISVDHSFPQQGELIQKLVKVIFALVTLHPFIQPLVKTA